MGSTPIFGTIPLGLREPGMTEPLAAPVVPLWRGARDAVEEPGDAGASPDQPSDFVSAMCTGAGSRREDENPQSSRAAEGRPRRLPRR
jgi:hypothetical protein